MLLSRLFRRDSRKTHTYCSFCGKRHDEVLKLIAGPDVNICDECVHLCDEILAASKAPNTPDDFEED